jgi:hypothetical protein
MRCVPQADERYKIRVDVGARPVPSHDVRDENQVVYVDQIGIPAALLVAVAQRIFFVTEPASKAEPP